MPRIACAAAYKKLGEKMKLLWDGDLKINAVSVVDVCRAIVAVKGVTSTSVFNLADASNLDQGSFNKILAELFKIETGFAGTITSNLAKLALSSVAAEANDKHVPAFKSMCQEHKVESSSITPYIDRELLLNNHLAVDGSAICKALDFSYSQQVSTDTIRDVLKAVIEQNIFPPVI